MRYRVRWAPGKAPSTFVSRDGVVISATPAMEWAVGLAVEKVVSWLGRVAIPWQVVGADCDPGLILQRRRAQ